MTVAHLGAQAAAFDPQAIAIVLFRIIVLAAGTLFAVLGYRLFKIGYFEKAGELKAAWGNKNLSLKQVAPGVFFALFGAVIVAIGTWKPISFTAQSLPPEIVGVLQKVINNEPVTDSDKSTVKAWLSPGLAPFIGQYGYIDWSPAMKEVLKKQYGIDVDARPFGG
jgi:hypothetical protein